MSSEHIPLLVIGAVALVLLVWFFGNYNALVRLRQHTRESWAGIDVQLKRRYDLIPNLVETVKGYAAHEREVLERVTELRGRAAANRGSVASQGRDEQRLVAGMRQLFALVENYPELKADRSFLALQEELTDTEDRIAASRRFFNANVRDYNTRREVFPSNIVASLFRFQPQSFWEVEDRTQRTRPDVEI
ncbi:MAG: LemA family protein [Planctomycetota bacterium]